MSLPWRNPVGVVLSSDHDPRVAASRQPWAGGRNAFGVFPRGTVFLYGDALPRGGVFPRGALFLHAGVFPRGAEWHTVV